MNTRQRAASRQIKYAEVSEADNVLTIRTLLTPCKYDFKVLVMQQWLPIMLWEAVGLGLALWLAPGSGWAEFLALIAGMWTFVCLTIVVRILSNMQDAAIYTFDRDHDEVRVNGRAAMRLSSISVGLDTQLGWSGNRRFRLVVRERGRPEAAMTQTPLLEDGWHAQQYYAQTYDENIRFMFASWREYSGQRGSV